MDGYRSAQLLSLWRDVSMGLVRDEKPDLTNRQITILLTIYLDTPPHTVRGLARKLNVTKPVITRALNTMGGLNLVERRRDTVDKRNVIISRTVEGTLYLEHLADLIEKHAESIG